MGSADEPDVAEQRENLRELFAALKSYLVTEILPTMRLDGDRFSFAVVDDAAFNASIWRVGGPTDRFQVRINEGLVTKAFGAIDCTDSRFLDPLLDAAERLLGTRERIDQILLFLFEATLAFCMLHEIGHGMAGHLHALSIPAGAGFTEAQPPPDRLSLAFEASVLEGSLLQAVFEMEADATAYGLIRDIAHDLFRATPGVAEAQQGSGETRGDAANGQQTEIAKLVLYACSIAAALTDIERQDTATSGGYPAAFTRMLGILIEEVRHGVPGRKSLEGYATVHLITAKSERYLHDELVPAMSTAIRLSAAAARELGHELATRVSDSMVAAGGSLGHDLGVILTGSTEQLTTEAARELVLLQATRTALMPRLERFRQNGWWRLPGKTASRRPRSKKPPQAG